MKKQNGYIYRRAGWWVLRYRENLLENGQIVRKQLAKQLAEVKPEHARLKRPPADVEDMAEDFLRPLNRGEANPEATQTIRQFAEDLFFPMLERQVRESTRKGYRARWVSQLLPRCGDLRLRDLTALSVQRIIDDVNRQNPKMKRSSLAHLKNLLSLIFDEALRLGCADAARGNPARLIKIPRAPEGDETHSYTLRDVETMVLFGKGSPTANVRQRSGQAHEPEQRFGSLRRTSRPAAIPEAAKWTDEHHYLRLGDVSGPTAASMCIPTRVAPVGARAPRGRAQVDPAQRRRTARGAHGPSTSRRAPPIEPASTETF